MNIFKKLKKPTSVSEDYIVRDVEDIRQELYELAESHNTTISNMLDKYEEGVYKGRPIELRLHMLTSWIEDHPEIMHLPASDYELTWLDQKLIEGKSSAYKGHDFVEIYELLGINYNTELVLKLFNSNCKVPGDPEDILFNLAEEALKNLTEEDTQILKELRSFLCSLSNNCCTYWQGIWKAGWRIRNDYSFLQFFRLNYKHMWN